MFQPSLLTAVYNVPSLRHLHIDFNVSLADPPSLPTLPALRSLCLHDGSSLSSFHHKLVSKELFRSPSLQRLHINLTQPRPEFLNVIENITSLEIEGSNTPWNFQKIPNFQHLQSLSLSGTKIITRTLSILQLNPDGCRNLLELRVAATACFRSHYTRHYSDDPGPLITLIGTAQLERLTLCGFNSRVLTDSLHSRGSSLREFVFHGLDLLPPGPIPRSFAELEGTNLHHIMRGYLPMPLTSRAPPMRPDPVHLTVFPTIRPVEEYSLKTKAILRKLQSVQKDNTIIENIGLDVEEKDVMCTARLQISKCNLSLSSWLLQGMPEWNGDMPEDTEILDLLSTFPSLTKLSLHIQSPREHFIGKYNHKDIAFIFAYLSRVKRGLALQCLSVQWSRDHLLFSAVRMGSQRVAITHGGDNKRKVCEIWDIQSMSKCWTESKEGNKTSWEGMGEWSAHKRYL
jgi:hypothetical protein